MAVVLIDGFDHYSAANATAKGWNAAAPAMASGRFGVGQALRINSNTQRLKLLSSTYSTLIAGIAISPSVAFNASDVFRLFTTGGTVVGCRVVITALGKIQVLNAGGTVVLTSVATYALGAWHYIEIKITEAGAAGSVELHVDGVLDTASTTGNFGSVPFDGVALIQGSNTVPTAVLDFDDLYLADTTGAAPRNNFLGDVRVETLYPSADGASSAWVPNSGTDHFSRVNEHTGTFPDGDTSYVSDATPGDIDTYVADDLSISSGTVYAVQTNLYARKDDAGVRQIADVVRQGGVNNVGSTKTMASTYAFYSELRNQDPSAADWTISNVNADEYGAKVIA